MKPIPDRTLPIVGVDYPNKRGPTRRFGLELCRPGDPIELRPEPKNPYDEHAIAVFNNEGIQLGYIPSEKAVWIGQLIREGREVVAVFQVQTRAGGLIRLAFDGSTPDLPPALGADPEPEWWPDEIPPDE